MKMQSHEITQLSLSVIIQTCHRNWFCKKTIAL